MLVGVHSDGIDGMLNNSKIVTYIFLFRYCLFFMKSPVQWVVIASKTQTHKTNTSDSAVNDLFIRYKNMFCRRACWKWMKRGITVNTLHRALPESLNAADFSEKLEIALSAG